WNHSLFKPLLFFGAGSVIYGTKTRDIDRLGGLSRLMPRTAGFLLIGAIAICGLPPMNGFVGELLIYLGLFKTLGINQGAAGGWAWAAFAAPLLAMIGAMAAVCFVKAFGTIFLGTPRTN